MTSEVTCPKCGFPSSVLHNDMCGECCAWIDGPWDDPPYMEPDDFEYHEFDESSRCHYCDGDGWGLVGVDWDTDDPVNGPYEGDIQRCPCCNGSGDANDCTFW